MLYSLALIALSTSLALISLGGGAYEILVVDPAWPGRPELIQPERGGVSRRRFWIPAHSSFELLLIASVIAGWSQPSVRAWLLVALSTHAVMRVWSLFDFIPKALAFERADPQSVDPRDARRWSRRSLGRLPLSAGTCCALMVALIAASRLG